MTLKQRIARIQMLFKESERFAKQGRKELRALKTATADTFQKIHEDAVPDLPFDKEVDNGVSIKHDNGIS